MNLTDKRAHKMAEGILSAVDLMYNRTTAIRYLNSLLDKLEQGKELHLIQRKKERAARGRGK